MGVKYIKGGKGPATFFGMVLPVIPLAGGSAVTLLYEEGCWAPDPIIERADLSLTAHFEIITREEFIEFANIHFAMLFTEGRLYGFHEA